MWGGSPSDQNHQETHTPDASYLEQGAGDPESQCQCQGNIVDTPLLDPPKNNTLIRTLLQCKLSVLWTLLGPGKVDLCVVLCVLSASNRYIYALHPPCIPSARTGTMLDAKYQNRVWF